MASWSDIQRGIFAGESGGDYNALFNYQNRPNGIFADVRVTDMSIADVLRFTDPSGEYGQYVAATRPDPEMGVATPVGAYQVVGSTLRDAVKALNLDPNQKFDKTTQDKVGQWIYKTQGTGAWQGYQGQQSKPKDTNMSMNPNAPQRTGLLGFMDIMRRPDEATGMTAMERFGAALDPLLAPNQRMGEQLRASGARRLQTQSKNKTIDTLSKRAEAGDQLAAMVLQGLQSGAYDAKTAMSLYMGKKLETPKTTETFSNMTGAQLNEKFGTDLDPSKMYNVSSSGKITQVGGGGVTIEGDKGVDEFAKQDAKTLSDTFSTGVTAASNLNKINRLDSLLQSVETGSMAALKNVMGNFGIETEGLGDIQAAQALINAMVPAQRPAGSGPMSDADLELFKQSLPRLINQSRGNEIIIATLRGIAQYDAMGADIVQKYRTGDLSKAEAFQQLMARPDPFSSSVDPTSYLPET